MVSIGTIFTNKILAGERDLLEEEESGQEIVSTCQAKIKLKFDEVEIDTWVDTGAMNSVIREDVFLRLKNKGYIKETLPVTNLKLYGALGRKSEKVAKQALLEIKYGKETLLINCLVLKSLFTELIIGIDFLRKIKAKIDFEDRNLRGVARNLFGEEISVTWPLLEINDSDNLGYIAYVEQSIEDREQIERINKFNILEQKVSEISDISDAMRGELLKLIKSNGDVFDKEPGMLKECDYYIETISHKPFKGHTYPIPYSLKNKVLEAIDRLVHDNIIERCQSEYVNPLCVLKKGWFY